MCRIPTLTLVPGMYAEASLTLDRANGVLIAAGRGGRSRRGIRRACMVVNHEQPDRAAHGRRSASNRRIASKSRRA